MVGWDHVPRGPRRRGGGDRVLERADVVVEARSLGDVRRVELPLLAGRVEPREESVPLRLLRDVQEELHDLGPVAVEVALEGVDVLVALLPEASRHAPREASAGTRAIPGCTFRATTSS